MSRNTVSRFEMNQLVVWAFGAGSRYTEQYGMGQVADAAGTVLLVHPVEPGAPKVGRKLIGRAIIAAKVDALQADNKPRHTWHPWVLALCAFFGFDLDKKARVVDADLEDMKASILEGQGRV